jgi:hypothetical protein
LRTASLGFLVEIETSLFNSAAAPALDARVAGGPEEAMQIIIRHWSLITGRDEGAEGDADFGLRRAVEGF